VELVPEISAVDPSGEVCGLSDPNGLPVVEESVIGESVISGVGVSRHRYNTSLML
jgi:hypothetical protein